MSLLTGEPRTATVTAKTDCDVVEIDHIAMRDLLKRDPKLADHLSETLSARRSLLESELANWKDDQENTPISKPKKAFWRGSGSFSAYRLRVESYRVAGYELRAGGPRIFSAWPVSSSGLVGVDLRIFRARVYRAFSNIALGHRRSLPPLLPFRPVVLVTYPLDRKALHALNSSKSRKSSMFAIEHD